MDNLKLSIYFGYHDSCITFANSSKILLHLEAERVFRKKHIRINDIQMEELIKEGLIYLGADIKDITEVYLAKWNNKFSTPTAKILGKNFRPVMTGHHLNHLGTGLAFGDSDALVVCADGGSEDGTTKLYKYSNGFVSLIEDLDHTIMTGKFYGTITQMIISPKFKSAHDTFPGKTMGLAALGSFNRNLYNKLISESHRINKLYNKGCEQLRHEFGLSENFNQPWKDAQRCDLAYTAQKLWVDSFFERIRSHAKESKNIILVGGCAYNAVLNSRLIESGVFENVRTTPVAGDCGQSLGALLFHDPKLKCNYPFLGRSYGEIEHQTPKLIESIVNDIISEKIICWYQGASEIGPRALGHRSFLGLPSTERMRIRLSEEVKKREPYRPVAPIVPVDDYSLYFEGDAQSPYMTLAPRAKDITRRLCPAIVHFDGTSRAQTLSREENPVIYDVLAKMKSRGLPPILMNTSFNINGKPIVDTLADCKKGFKQSGAEVLYINGKRYNQYQVKS